jgi:hypothetical protein
METMQTDSDVRVERVRLMKLAHPSLPEVTLRMDLVKHRQCRCAVANEVLATLGEER